MTTTTRRALLGAAAAAPVVAIAPGAAARPSNIRPAFLRKLERVRRLERAHATYEEQVVQPTEDRCSALMKEVPHTRVHLGANYAGKPIIFSTDKASLVATAKRYVADPTLASTDLYLAGCRQIAEAFDQRERAQAEILERFRMAELSARSDRLLDICAQAEAAVCAMRVGSAEELALKLAFLVERRLHGEWETRQLLADAQALAGGGAA